MSTAETLISMQDVGCSYNVREGLFRTGEYTVLSGVNLDVFQGETLGIIGRNGVGKSTLLRLMARIILPDQGRIVADDALTISLLTLQLGFSTELSGYENAILSAMLLGHSRKQTLEMLPAITEFAGLEEWMDKPLKVYSTGMRARLGFSVAIQMSPDVLLVDEMLGVGDQDFRKKSTWAMKHKMRSDQTVVFVSHNQPVLRELCSRLVWLDQGRVRMIDSVDTVLEEYNK
ncbi:ABC transporter ATP-binding protein [Pseudodesulfovibrio senegalensis]|jgi:lipopolysaccharide transport system ATP-binding protein|uniref:ABC transporter ATP-binding protein n=1 Tax=Pseudodesulfovibrio senegalensis TaxID=1721087 RepID=A0A6N6N438_9BACT|nr:ABC transporter ATP-binding protein [Pseudodesulfovibrio senegalensis]KAB1441444.1 ABC transporter ATP-binding protein [Pseudodesulfovibrio senegalensis]